MIYLVGICEYTGPLSITAPLTNQLRPSRTMSVSYRKTNKPTRSKIDKKKSLLIVFRHMNQKGIHVDTSVEIRSQRLFQLLLDVNRSEVLRFVKDKSPPRVC